MDIKKKLDGSPRTVKKKKIIMQINSDRQAIMNLNKNNKNNLNKSHAENNITGNAIIHYFQRISQSKNLLVLIKIY